MRPANPSERAAAALHAMFGDLAVLCIVDDAGKGGPAAPDPCDAHCPLCQAGAGALATVLPTPPAQPARHDVVVGFLTPQSPTRTDAALWRVAAEPRGPPAKV